MDIKKYEKSQYFERNGAIFILFAVDGITVQQIAANFNLEIEEVKDILALHEKYEDQMK